MLSDGGVLTISGTGSMWDYSRASVPWYSNSDSILSVVIENGVTTIGDYAFYNCTSLTSIDIPDSVTSIGDYAFCVCVRLTNIDLPEDVTSIGDWAFESCTSLYRIDLPDSLISIGSYAFQTCIRLSRIDIPDGVTSIGDAIFAGCTNLTSIDIPDGLTSIGGGAFSGCTRLAGIDIPDGVTSIGRGAFSGCTRLTSIDIPASVIFIGENAFGHCDSLIGINIDQNSPNYSNDSCGVLFDKKKTQLMQAPGAITGSYEIPGSVTAINGYAFCGCTSLASIDIPECVTSIGEFAFYECTSLSNIDIPFGVTTIEHSTFSGCTSLSRIDLPDGVTSIGEGVFWNCDSLTNIDLPDSITFIGSGAFYGCTNLTSIYFKGGAPTFVHDVFLNVTATAYYPAENSTWHMGVMKDYGGDITWVAYHLDNTHKYTAVVTVPTCTEQGFTTYTCFCGDSYVSDYVDALGHDMGEWKTVTAPTCTENGSESRGCSRCDYTENRAIDAMGHSYTGTVTAPTCTEQGFTTYTCSCGDSYVSDEVPALGHTEETIPAVAATCIETGLTEGKKCSVCGEVLVAQETVSALGHDWKGTSCQRCDTTRENPFTDVADGSFYINPVLWAVENGITSGTSETTFSPSGLCLRAHVVTFLHCAAGSPVPSSTQNRFTDVKSGDFFYKPVLWAVENNVTQGISEKQFGSAQVCNRASVVTFLWRAFGSPEPKSDKNPFVDVKSTDFFYKPVLWAVENGITSGADATHFNPAGACNRAQVVTFLYKAYN